MFLFIGAQLCHLQSVGARFPAIPAAFDRFPSACQVSGGRRERYLSGNIDGNLAVFPAPFEA